MIQLLIDEDMPDLLADVLRSRGRDVVHVRDLHRGGWSDSRVFEWAVAEGRAVATHNIRDFRLLARDHVAKGGHHHGLLLGDQAPFRELLQRVLRALHRFDDADTTDLEMWF